MKKYMTDLAKRLLLSIEQHGKSAMSGIYKLYAHETKKNIDAAVVELSEAGLVIYRETMVFEGGRVSVPNVRRSSKQLFIQQNLLDEEV